MVVQVDADVGSGSGKVVYCIRIEMMPNANGALGMVTPTGVWSPAIVDGSVQATCRRGPNGRPMGPLSWSSALLPNSDGRPIRSVGIGHDTTGLGLPGAYGDVREVAAGGLAGCGHHIAADQDGADQLLAQRRIRIDLFTDQLAQHHRSCEWPMKMTPRP